MEAESNRNTQKERGVTFMMLSGSAIRDDHEILAGSALNTKFMWCSSACGTPVAQITNGYLVIKSRHHGKPHMSAFSMKNVLEAMVYTAMKATVYSGASGGSSILSGGSKLCE